MGEPERVVVHTGLYGSLFQYNSEEHSWSEYVEIYGHYFTANKIEDDKIKVSILCANVGPKTYHVIKNLCLPAKPEAKTFKELTDTVKNHFKPKISEANASLIFGTRIRKKGETVQVFAAELRRLASACNYGAHLQRALRDRFIAGINDEAMQEKILNIPDEELTFEKAYQTAEAHESACRNVKEMQRTGQAASNATSHSVNKISPSVRSNPKKKPFQGARPKQQKKSDQGNGDCFRCGLKHNANICWFKDKECFNCKKRGHTKAMCKTASVKHVSYDSENDSDVEIHTMYSLQSLKVPPIEIELGMKGKTVTFEVDMGSPYTMVTEDTVNRVYGGSNYQMNKAKVKVRSYTGHDVLILGEIEMEVTFKSEQHRAKMLVTNHKPNLIGRDLIQVLGIVQVNQLSHVETLQTVLERHESVFNSELGMLKGVQAKIHVDRDAAPLFFKARPLPYAMKSKVEAELKKLEASKIIEPVKFSEWAAPVVPVLKPNGDVRLCGDYKVTVNRVSKLEQYPIPTLEELTMKLAHGSVFHKLDLSHAYSQMELDPESRKYVTVNTHKGLYQYTRLPFGVSSAPAIFQRVMDSLLQGIPSVAAYLDDILVTGSTVKESLDNLEAVLSRLEEAGLRLRKEKCAFMAEEVTYLGHQINKTGITPVSEKVKAIVQAQPPMNVSQLKAFLGLLNYYGKFLKDLSSELHPLHKLLQKDVAWKWGPRQQQCFEKVKGMIVSAKVLVHYDPTKPLLLQCDASQYGLGAVLSHVMDDGTERPIGFVSRTLNVAEKNYSQLDKEGAGIIFGLKKFHKYVYGRHFTIVTDHKPLITLFHEEKQIPVMASPRVLRWAVILRAYQYNMVFKAGKEHLNADCLSRLPLPVTDPVEEHETVLMMREIEDCTLLTADEIAEWTKYDPVLSHVHEYLLRGWPSQEANPELAAYRVRKDELSVQDGCVLWGPRVVIPPKGRQQVLQELHTAHPGINRMKSLARSYVWYPGMDKDLEKLVQSCEVCQEHRKSPPLAPLHPWEYPDGPWKRIHIDYAGPYKGHMFLIVVDAFSKWIEVFIMQNTNSEATIRKLRECFAQHGIPDILVSDNASNFKSEEFATFMRQNGIEHCFVAPFHPSGNGLAERAVQTVKGGLDRTAGDSIHTKLHRFLLQYRITPQTTTGKSPAELLNHRRLKTTLDLLHPKLKGRVHLQQEKMAEYRARKAHNRTMDIGDRVGAKNFSSGTNWLPGVVVKKAGPVSYEIELDDGRVIRRHVDHMLKRSATSKEDSQPPVTLEEPVNPGIKPQQLIPLPVIEETVTDNIEPTKVIEMPIQPVAQVDQPMVNTDRTPIRTPSKVPGNQEPSPRYPARDRKPPEYLKDFVKHVLALDWDDDFA